MGCIGTRLLLTYLAKIASKDNLKLMGYLTLIPAIGFITIWYFGLRSHGLKVPSGVIWWNHLRPVHAFFYGLFSLLAIKGNKNAWMVLLIDTIFGLLAYLNHYKYF